MQLNLYKEVGKFLEDVQPYLESHESANGLLLGLLLRLAAPQPNAKAFMVSVTDTTGISGVALFLDRGLVLSHGETSWIDLLPGPLLEGSWKIPGVVAPVAQADYFASLWVKHSGMSSRLAYNQRIYELRRVTKPQGVPGALRLMTEGDIGFMPQWMDAFYKEAVANEVQHSYEFLVKDAHDRAKAKNTYLWCVNDRPVAMAALARPTRRGETVNLVYTPPEYRRSGYASAVVAAVSQVALDAGKEFCMLYTDLANPTSNSIYPKVGYLPVCDSRQYLFL